MTIKTPRAICHCHRHFFFLIGNSAVQARLNDTLKAKLKKYVRKQVALIYVYTGQEFALELVYNKNTK